MAKKTLLELIEARFGKVTAFDGRLCVWMGSLSMDIRDIARLMKVDSGDVADCIPAFEPVKRGRRSAAVTEETPDADNP
jgi:hypothetical protein